MRSPIDPYAIRDGGNWEVYEVTPEYRRSRLWLDENKYIIRTEYLQDDELIELNRQEFNDSHTKRFSDDAMGTKVASIPLNRFYQDVAPRLKEGDKDFLPWYLDKDENRWMRTFRGTMTRGRKRGKSNG